MYIYSYFGNDIARAKAGDWPIMDKFALLLDECWLVSSPTLFVVCSVKTIILAFHELNDFLMKNPTVTAFVFLLSVSPRVVGDTWIDTHAGQKRVRFDTYVIAILSSATRLTHERQVLFFPVCISDYEKTEGFPCINKQWLAADGVSFISPTLCSMR